MSVPFKFRLIASLNVTLNATSLANLNGSDGGNLSLPMGSAQDVGNFTDPESVREIASTCFYIAESINFVVSSESQPSSIYATEICPD